MGVSEVWSKLRQGLSKTRESLAGRIQTILAGGRPLDSATLEELEECLLAADVGMSTTSAILEGLQRRARERAVTTAAGALPLLREELERTLSGLDPGPDPIPATPRPYVILVVGVNGAGKTTTVGKLAHLLQQRGSNVLVGAGDTFRAAANEQLEVWAQRAGVEIVRQSPGADPASVAFDTVSAGLARKADVVLLDTAGRLHTKVNLMEELRKVHRVIGKRLEGAPHEVLLVLDATTGQNGIQQARQFAEAAGVTGLILTKLDGTAKGGIVVSIVGEQRIPVRFIGVGEGIDDLQPFDARQFADALLGPAGEESA